MYNILLTLILKFFKKLQIDIWYFFACRKVFAMNHKLQNSVFIQKKKYQSISQYAGGWRM